MHAPRAALVAALSLALTSACGAPKKNGNNTDGGNGDGGGGPPDACVGLECQIVDCTGQGIGTTQLSGTVYAPNGTLPLANAIVYIPVSAPGPEPSGLQCDQCTDALPGGYISKATTDQNGEFHLTNVPVAPNIPLVVTVGKWRKQSVIATAPTSCMDNNVDAGMTTLPGKRADGDMPNIAISTGSADALECLPLKLGIDPSEITIGTGGTGGTGGGHVQLFTGNGRSAFASTFANQGTFSKSETDLWDSKAHLESYDIVILSCEGGQPSTARAPATALAAVYQYANEGGRVFLSHWHNYWIEDQATVWPSIMTFRPKNGDEESSSTVQADVDMNAETGLFYKWLTGPKVAALTNGMLPVDGARNTCTAYDANNSERFVYTDNAAGTDNNGNPITLDGPQNVQFTTPNDAAPGQPRCGKVVFSDMHVSADSVSKNAYPGGCSTGALTPQEKALAFLFFDIAACVEPVIN